MHQNWMRDYDPTTGRYIEADPLGLVDGASVYGYVRQNLGRWIDPRGESSSEPQSTAKNSNRIEGLTCASVTEDQCGKAYELAGDLCRSIGTGSQTTAARKARQRCWEDAEEQYAKCIRAAGNGNTFPYAVTPFIGPFAPGRRGFGGGGRITVFPWNSVIFLSGTT